MQNNQEHIWKILVCTLYWSKNLKYVCNSGKLAQ